MRFDQLSLLAVLLGVSACSGPTSVTEDDFTIRATGQEVVLRNGAARPTFYLIVERETAAVIDFVTCVDESQCPHVASGATVRVPYSAISGYRPGKREAIVYWWRSVLSPTGPQADSFHSTVMRL
jgi:hypothetical protein